jgi:uncharacterized protein YeaO (DUF488 family)
MTIRIVRLGAPRDPHEGPRIGAVRRPPRGVRKERYAADDWFDVWYPELSPSAALLAQGKAADTPAQWNAFVRAFKTEMAEGTPSRTLNLLATLSLGANFSLGCYCVDEARCHRSVLRKLLTDRGAALDQA